MFSVEGKVELTVQIVAGLVANPEYNPETTNDDRMLSVAKTIVNGIIEDAKRENDDKAIKYLCEQYEGKQPLAKDILESKIADRCKSPLQPVYDREYVRKYVLSKVVTSVEIGEKVV